MRIIIHLLPQVSEEIRNKMSEAKGTTIFLYSLELELLSTFTSIKIAANLLNAGETTISKYIKSGAVFREKYILSSVLLDKDFKPTNNVDRPGKALIIRFHQSLHDLCLETFSSATQAAKYFGSKKETILKYVRSGDIFRDQYILSLEDDADASSE